MVIRWLGHASFLIVSSGGTKIITDPYEPNAFGGALKHRPIEMPPDIVTVSHDHADHNYINGLPNHFSVVSRPGTTDVEEIEFKGVESYHDSERGALRGTNIIFVMDVDGVRVCHLGDLGHELSGPELNQLGEVDVLLIPVGGKFTIGPAEAARVVGQLNPRVVIPMHYKTDKVDFPIAPVDDFLAGKQNVRRLDSSEYEVVKEQLPDRQEIIVLKYAL